MKEELKTDIAIIPKVWGHEKIIINCDKYCGKLLYLDKGACSSVHYHKKKQETFYALSGQSWLYLEGEEYMLNKFAGPKTVLPGQKHLFHGLSDDAVILEISTYHSEDDVVRLTDSKPKP